MAEIKQLLKLPDGTIRVLVEGLRRVRIEKYIQIDPYYMVQLAEVFEIEEKNIETEALMRSTLYQFEQFIKIAKRFPRRLWFQLIILKSG